MTTFVRWPDRLHAREVSFNPRGQAIGGPVSITGQSQVVASDAGYWVASVPLAPLERGRDVNAFRAFRAEMEGGANPVLVPAFDYGQAPWPYIGGWEANVNADQSWSDSKAWSDGTGWYRPAIRIYVEDDAALRDNEIVVDKAIGGELMPGMLFSLAGGGMHVIRKILATSGSQQTLRIWPALRADAPAGRRCNFERPVCRMRLMSDEEADLVLGLLWIGRTDLAFIEVF